MWPMRMDMSWDECRQCLRCLELDAYGNMVSVLRAQGPFTEDKKKLLGELAKVLHITNERHRAEVRRAVNDEKLSLIAEQLNGPNTWTDWAIEGRRTIPLLPRLKSHTAFTGLANSLSLVIAAANEKKIPCNAQPESIVKGEASTLCKNVIVEEKPLKCSVSNYQASARGRKRKRSLTEIGDLGRNTKQNINKKLNSDSGVNSLNVDGEKSVSPLEINSLNAVRNDSSMDKSRCYNKSLMRNSVTCTVSPNELSNLNNSINNMNSITCHDNAITQSKITAINVNSDIDVQLELEERLTYEINELNDVDPNRNSENNKFQIDSVINDDSNTLTCENTQLSPSEVDRMSSPALSQPSSPIQTENTTQIVTINSDSTSSSGPGPPNINSPILSHNKLPIKTLNHHNITDMEITFNSNKTVNINNLPKAQIDTKIKNVIGVQKGPTCGIKWFNSEKKVLGKLISNNGDQTVNTMPMLKSSQSNDLNIANPNLKIDNIVMLDIRQDVDNTKSIAINNDVAIDIFHSDNKTAVSNMDAHNLMEYSNEDCSSILAHHVDIVHTENNITDDENGDRNENLEIESTAEVEEQLECVVIDGETEIYNFESTEENICEIQIEESTEDVDEFNSTELVTSDINIDNFNYVEDDEETVSIPEDERGQYEQFNELSDS